MKKILIFFTSFPPSLSSGGKLMVVKQLFKRVFVEGPPLVTAPKGSKYERKDHLFYSLEQNQHLLIEMLIESVSHCEVPTPDLLNQSLLYNRIPWLFEYTLREPWEALG